MDYMPLCIDKVEIVDKKYINNNKFSTNFDSKNFNIIKISKENRLGIVEVQYKLSELGNEITIANAVEVVTQIKL